jgi:hypothetical protein
MNYSNLRMIENVGVYTYKTKNIDIVYLSHYLVKAIV